MVSDVNDDEGEVAEDEITYDDLIRFLWRAEQAGLVVMTCGTHDVAPLDEGREAEFEDGGDPCVPIVAFTKETLEEHHRWG